MITVQENPLKCACLVARKHGSLLLVRVRKNEHWYLPGGKIENGETPEQALERELMEELGISVDPATISYLYTINAAAYGQTGNVELICFTAQWHGTASAKGEIASLDWIPIGEMEKLAPAVQLLCRLHLGASD